MKTQDQVRTEVESLHAFFCGWFGGSLPEAVFEAQFVARFASDLVFVPPAGKFLGLDDLSGAVRAGYATNPNFRVQIRNVTVHREFAGHIVATYEEWQRNALASQPPDNGRLATAIFAAGEKLQWLHIHETWLPQSVMAADKFEF